MPKLEIDFPLNKKGRQPITSPVGVACFPKLTSPDETYGGYSVALVLDPKKPEVAAFLKTIKDAHAQAVAVAKKSVPTVKACSLPIQPDTDRDKNPTGLVRVRFKAQETIKVNGVEKDNAPRLVDRDAKPLAKGLDVNGGSTIRCSGVLHQFYKPGTGAGVTFRLYGVQVLKLIERKPLFEAMPEDAGEIPDASDVADTGAAADPTAAGDPETASGESSGDGTDF